MITVIFKHNHGIIDNHLHVNMFEVSFIHIFLSALLGELCMDMYVQLCHVIPLCIGLKIIPQLCEIILLDLQTRSMNESFAKPTCVTPLITCLMGKLASKFSNLI